MPTGVIELYLRFLVAGFALLLTTVAVVAYRRSPNRRLLFVAGALGLFAVSGAWMAASALWTGLGDQLLLGITVLDVAILVLLYLSMIQPLRTHR